MSPAKGWTESEKEWKTKLGVSKVIPRSCADLSVAAAVFCRAGWQDDSAGHQNLQQDHQDEVKIDLNTKWEGGIETQQLAECETKSGKSGRAAKKDLHWRQKGSGSVCIQTTPGRWSSQQMWTRRPPGSPTPWKVETAVIPSVCSFSVNSSWSNKESTHCNIPVFCNGKTGYGCREALRRRTPNKPQMLPECEFVITVKSEQ